MQPSDSLAVTIRPATPADLAVLGRLGALLVQMHHNFDPQRFIAAPPGIEQGYAAFLGTQLDNPNVVVLVAERNGAVVGYTYARVEGWDYMSLRGPAGVLHDIVVDPAQRGTASVGCCSTPPSRRSRPVARPGSCYRQPRGMRPRSACSLARGSGGR